jgi:3-isopropylmalate dehydrogenase
MTGLSNYTVACLSGDGIGPELMAEASRALAQVAHLHGFEIEQLHLPFAGEAITRSGHALPASTRRACRAADAALVMSAGSAALDGLRAELDLQASVARFRTRDGDDVTVIAPLAEGADDWAVERAFQSAHMRTGALVSVAAGPAFAALVRSAAERHPGIDVVQLSLGEVLPLLALPSGSDVLVTERVLFEALASLPRAGSGRVHSAALGFLSPAGPGVFLPTHGPAADIAGQGVADPSEVLLAAALLLGEGLGRWAAASTLEESVVAALRSRTRTADRITNGVAATTREFSDVVLSMLPGSRRDTELPLWAA